MLGIAVDLTSDPYPSHSPSRSWLGARSCLRRSTYPAELAPPTESMEEACQRYRMPHPPPAYSTPPPPAYSTNGVDSSRSSNSSGEPHAEQSSHLDRFVATPSLCKEDETVSSTSNSTSLSSSTKLSHDLLEAPPTPVGLEEVKYEVLVEATDQFDDTLYKEGGHKVGEGGFGEVFHCSLILQNGPVHAAVKVLFNQVCRPTGDLPPPQ